MALDVGLPPFLPDPARAAVIDRGMRVALIDSLTTVFDTCEGHLAWRKEDQHALLAALRSHAIQPAAFALYAELVGALLDENQCIAQARLDALLRPGVRAWHTPRVITLDNASLGEGTPALYARTIDDDPDMPVQIAAVGPAELARGEALHEATRELLRQAASDLLWEIETVAPEIVLVRDARVDESRGGFCGASTFYLWGAMILNSTRQQTRPQMAESLAHEAAHAILLGSTLGEPMVFNDPAERYQSPLRADARPMDGIVHASFVLARMMWCQDRLLQSGLLRAAEQEETALARALNRRRFIESSSLIESDARFTPGGARLWSAARDWVSQVG